MSVADDSAPSSTLIDELIAAIREGRQLRGLVLAPGLRDEAGSWQDARALTTAARLADRLGAGKLSLRWHRQNHRRHPDDPVCFLHRAWELARTIGLTPALRLVEQRLGDAALAPGRRSDLLALAVGMLAGLRDFETGHRLMDEALSLRPGHPWLLSCRASLLRAEDRRDEALVVVRDALAAQPASGAALEITAGLLVDLGRPDEAAAVLEEGCARTDHASLRWMRYIMHSEREEAEPALRWLEDYERCQPLMGEDERQALDAGRTTLHLLRGDLDEAVACARRRGGHFHERLVENIERARGSGAQRRRLPVGFVRQHHMTCAPATLAALAAWWGRPAAHTEIAEKICYDGTPSFSERCWAREHGLDGREFRVTPEITRELVARGVPFTLVTTWPTGAHLQAVIGTDERAGLLLIRDPMSSHYTEALLEGFLADYAAHGPRGMLVLPEGERARLDGLTLPEAEIHDALHEVEGALQRHDRAAAEAHYEAMMRKFPDHRLTWVAYGALAACDDDPVKAEEASQALLRLHPGDAALQWRAFRSAGMRQPRAALLQTLEERVAQPECDDVFRLELARRLADDARTAPRAARLLGRVLRHRPADAVALVAMADVAWVQRRFDDALALYRLAACAADKNEGIARTYASAARRLHRADEAIAFLERRVATLGGLSGAPAITLADCLTDLLRVDEALRVIEKARARRSDDGSLTLHESCLLRQQGRFDDAAERLARAEGTVPVNDWLREAAALAEARGDSGAADGFRQRLLETEPLAMDAHEALVRSAAARDGTGAAHALLEIMVQRFPWHMGIARLRVDWLRREGAPAADEIRRILAHNPADDWAWRELALELSGRHDQAGAAAAAAESVRLAPRFAWSHSIAALVARAAGDAEAAHASARRALELDVTCGAMATLLATAGSAGARRQCLDFIRGQLEAQTGGAAAVGQFHATAQPVLTTDELTAVLRAGQAARPDMFETWASLAEHLVNLGHPEASGVTREMTERFPWAPGSWRLHAQACGAAGWAGERLAALQRAVAINPQWSLAVRELAELHEREGRVPEALAVMERLVKARPLDPANHGVLADMLLRQGHIEDGMAALERAVAAESGYDWGWAELCRRAAAAGVPERAEAAALRLTETRPHEARSWIVLTEVRCRLGGWEQGMAAADEALRTWPRNVRLHELRALVFSNTGRRDDAIAACRPAAFLGRIPRELRGREAALRIDAADYAGAERLLTELIADEPDYAWARSLMYDIRRMRGEHRECLALARELVRIEPDNAVAHGMLAESLMATGAAAEAMVPVRRALELDPRYVYAANRLFENLVERDDLTGAAELAALMERFQSRERSLAARARLAIRAGRRDEVLACQEELIASATPEAEEVAAGWGRTVQAGGSRAADDYAAALDRAMAAGTLANAGTAVFWAHRQQAAGVRKNLGRLLAAPLPDKVRVRFIAELLNHAVENGAPAQAVKVLEEQRSLMRGETMLWGTGSYVLLVAGRTREAMEWLADWRERKDREPWMVANHALATAHASGPLAAEEAWREVLAAGASNVWAQAAAGLAFVEAVRGRFGAARQHLENLEGLTLQQQDKFTAAMARVALAAAEHGDRPASAAAEQARRLFMAAEESWPGGLWTDRGRRTLTELKAFVTRNDLPSAFASPPSAVTKAAKRQHRQPAEVPWRVIFAGIIILAGALRNCHQEPPPPPLQPLPLPRYAPPDARPLDVRDRAPVPPASPQQFPLFTPDRDMLK